MYIVQLVNPTFITKMNKGDYEKHERTERAKKKKANDGTNKETENELKCLFT